MSNIITPEFQADNLRALIKQLIKEQQYEGVALLFTSSKEAPRNIQCLPKIAMNLYHEVCIKNISDKIYQENIALYSCAEKLLKLVASYAPTEELLLELLDIIECNKDEHVFTAALKALQIVLFRHGDQKPRALEWSLNSIVTRLQDLPVPDSIKEGYDNKQKNLLEQDNKIQNLLMHYVIVGFFYNPLIERMCSQPRNDKEIFRPVSNTNRNVLCCFLVKLLGKPLSLLDLSNESQKKTNKYSLQCAVSLTNGITKCVGDPLFLLPFVETRSRVIRRLNESKGVHEMSSSNIFMINEKLPLDCLAVYYYMVLAEGIDIDLVPKVYQPLYIMETCLYLVYELLLQHEPALQEKAVLLMDKLLTNLKHTKIPVSSLDLMVHKSFCITLCNLVGYSSHVEVRRLGIRVLRMYILCFEDEGKYAILKNLLKSIQHPGICGYLSTLYKDLVTEALNNSSPMPSYFCGADFRSLMLQSICKLPQGVETALLENSDKIISALNVIRFFALRDLENRTGFWSFSSEINENYLKLLSQALDLSIAHFKAELYNVKKGVVRPQLNKLNLLDVHVANDKESKLDLQLDRTKQIHILNRNLCEFDLMRCLLSRAIECLENSAQFKSS